MPETPQVDVLFTLVAAISAGVILTAVARRLDFSAIVLLLLGGVLLGPRGLGIVKPDSLQHGLPAFVSLAVGLILFEGGLTLNVQGYRKASRIIIRLLTGGVLVTWLMTAAALYLLLGLSADLSLVAGSLVIVTGPTVIGPLLRKIRIQQPLHDILHWESVLIDPIGVFVAVLCFEWISGFEGRSALVSFGLRLLGGLACGAAGGLLLSWLIRARVFGEELIDLVPLAGAAAIFGFAEAVIGESGLLAATTAGFVLGLSRPPQLARIQRFKAAVSDLLIGMLFILLAARLNPGQFVEFGLTGLLTVAVVVFVVRAANIALSTAGEPLNWRQRGFLAWVAPRGIVAASMSSLFALRLQQSGVPRAEFVETFTYSVIVLTVLLQGLSAGWVARRLGLRQPEAKGWLIVGAHLFGRKIADFISRTAQVPVVLLDLNDREVDAARKAGLTALAADARDTSIIDEWPEMPLIGNLLAITDNGDLNHLLCQRWAEVLGEQRVHGWHSKPESRSAPGQGPAMSVWPSLPKPSIVSGDLERRLLNTVEQPAPTEASDISSNALLLASGNLVSPHPASVSKQARNSSARLLLLERRGSHLLAALHPRLFVRTRPDGIDPLLRQMTDLLVGMVPQLPADQIVAELVNRERLFSSSIGHGVAIPHTYCKVIQARRCVVAVLPDGLVRSPDDAEPIRLVFLVVGPPGDPEGHLACMAEIAGLVSDQEMRDRLLRADSFGELAAIVRNLHRGTAS